MKGVGAREEGLETVERELFDIPLFDIPRGWGLEVGGWALGIGGEGRDSWRVYGLGFRAECLECSVSCLKFGVQGLVSGV